MCILNLNPTCCNLIPFALCVFSVEQVKGALSVGEKKQNIMGKTRNIYVIVILIL